jgi:hypothetical protein
MSERSTGDEWPKAVMAIEDVETLKVIADPFRLEMIEAMGADRITVKELGARMGQGVHKLYYHVRLLEKHGIMIPVDSQIVSGIVEKTYALAAKRFEVKRGALSAGGVGAPEFYQVLQTLFDSTLEAARKAVEAKAVSLTEEDDERVTATRAKLHMTDDQARTFIKRFEELGDELSSEEPGVGTRPYGMTFIFHALAPGGSSGKEEKEASEESEGENR